MGKKSFRWVIVSYSLLLFIIAGLIVLVGVLPRSAVFPYVLAGTVIAVLLLGFVWMRAFYTHSYRPTRAVANLVSDKFGGSQIAGSPDTVHYIRSAIEDVAEQLSSLHHLTRSNHNHVKRQIFLNLIEGSHAPEQLRRQLEWPKLNMPGPDYLFVIVELDLPLSHIANGREQEYFLHRQTLRSAVQNKTFNAGMLIWSDWIDFARLGVIHNVKAEASAECGANALYEGIRSWAEQNLPFTVTVGISSMASGIERIAPAYKSVSEVLLYKPSLGINRVIRSDEAPATHQADLSRHLHHIRNMCVMLRTGDRKWSESVVELRSSLATEMLTLADLVLLFRYMMDHLHTELDQMPAELRKIWTNEKEQLEHVLTEAGTRNALLDGLQRHLEIIFEVLRQERESRHNRQLLHAIAEFIEEHCTKTEFALLDVSAAFGLSQNHLSRIISEGLGVKFVEYVTQIRIEKAKQLLLHASQMTVGDVGERVGYSHAVTFIRTFKKYTGCTPGNFRKDGNLFDALPE
jgi:AraC-like DNA-binding protein